MNIRWNEVTWYSKLIAVILFVATFYVGYWLGVQKGYIDMPYVYSPSDPNGFVSTNTKPTNTAPVNIKQCFARSQKATAAEPYSVDEHIVLNIKGSTVTGSKSGNQAGPGVSNGYTGTLTGKKNGTNITVVYAYIVEGSKNNESEEYVYENNKLKKLWYPLVESQDVLIPDKSKTPTELTYTEETCPN